MGGENWETRRGRSRAGLLRSPRDLHFVFATFGARPSLRNFDALLALLGTALATLGRSRALLAGYVQALQVRYQGAPKAGPNYVEIVGLQKLLGLSASLVAIGANPLDFLPTASPSSHHPHRPPGSGQFMGSFPPNVFLFTGHFFPENVFRPSTDPPLKVRMGPGPTFPVEKEIPVISPVLTVRAVQIGAPPWQSMRPMEKQEVRQVCSDRHETCTLIFQLFEIYILAD